MDRSTAIRALAALAHDGRLAIFRLLVRRAPDDVAAGEIALALGVRGSTLSNQLAELEQAGLVHARRRGRSMLYRVDLGAGGDLLRFLAADCCKGRPEACLPIATPFLRRAADREGTDMGSEPARRVYNVLFLCTGNSARSILAEAIMKRVGAGRFRGFSAGSQPKGEPHPAALRLLESFDYDVSALRSKSWDEFAQADAPPMDFVFTVCDNAANEVCPIWPGQPMTAHWGAPDPAAVEGSEAEIGVAFAETYRLMFNRISAFASLPISALDSLALQKRLDRIGVDRAEEPARREA